MRNLRETSIMEIDITNACVHKCSNCTRFCGHHEKPFFMDFNTFKKAVDSLEGYPGLISTIGGEPLIHPEYERFAEYLRGKRYYDYQEMNDGRCKAMVKDYLAFAKEQRWFQGALNKGRGNLLFTSMPGNYYNHYESVEETVSDLWLNDHTNPSFHQPILVSRKDLGISDGEFKVLRENCWLQNFWSGSITPKGCFFCEIAGTLDLLFDGPGGKKIEPGWWDKDISYFSDQYHWCDICGMALTTYSRNANEEMDDASPTLIKKLEGIRSPRLAKKRVYSFSLDKKNQDDNVGEDMGSVSANYLPDNNKRVGKSASFLRPSRIIIVKGILSQQDLKEAEDLLCYNTDRVDGFIIITYLKYEEQVKKIVYEYDNNTVIDLRFIDESGSLLGNVADAAVQHSADRDWIVIGAGGYQLPDLFSKRISSYYLNPGYCFGVPGHGREDSIIMFSRYARALKEGGRNELLNCKTVDDIKNLWTIKKYDLPDDFDQIEDVNIEYFKEIIRKNYLSDTDFFNRLKDRLSGDEGKNGKVIVLQSAFVYHTLGILYIIKNLGVEPIVFTNVKFEKYFDGVVDKDNVYVFSEESHFRYRNEEQTDLRAKIKKGNSILGAIVPFSFGPSTIKPIDDYTDALKTAEDVGGKIIGCVNIRREYIEPEYDIWSEGDSSDEKGICNNR